MSGAHDELLADVRAVREQVEQAVTAGLVPRSVQSFAELYEYVDPNEFLLQAPGFARRWSECDDPEECMPYATRLTDKIDAWLFGGLS